MRNNIAEMEFLYSQESIATQFSRDKFHQFLQEDMIFPLKGVRKKYSKNEIIIPEGEVTNEIYFIESGNVAATKDGENVINFYAENEIIGLTNLLLDSHSEYAFQVISNELFVTKYDKESIIEKVINTQEGYFYHYVHMQNQVSQMIEKEQLLRLPSEQRISLALLILGTKFGEETNDQDLIGFPKSISKGMIGQYTNLNPNTITNVLQKLQEEEIIYPARRAFYVDIFKLEIKLDQVLKK
ncbi:Crp/Fnr family transcriptional regulator [Listeria newyorkensis]|uniref:Crp/Fnr family transcriptional regulator n=1 Tax=Listeria newyorkensis TaxID=1497681 RepID=A0A841YZ10_9LIST|nr:Crp/Fnr family transcriptional regulator [Listeria newyorkensis]MBC1457863.1 Crp/Fnr family transcriptional regulator [Listeria newyorkensis]